MKDTDIYNTIMNDPSPEKGWEMLFRKYINHFKKVGEFYCKNHSEFDLKPAWSDAIFDAYRYVLAGKFIPKDNTDPNFLLPLIIRIARWKLNKVSKPKPNPPKPPDDPYIDISRIDDADMLLLHVLVKSLKNNNHKEILLLKYFPETPEAFGLTDKQIAQIMEDKTEAKWQREVVSIYKLKAIYALGKAYSACDKSKISQILAEQEESDFKFSNLNYPTIEIFRLLYRSDTADTDNASEAVAYLEGAKLETGPVPRFRVYARQAMRWVNRLLPHHVAQDEGKIISQVSSQLEFYKSKLFNK
jgi:hypothetical protein